MIELTCSACQKKLSAKETLAGKKVQCPGCGLVMLVAIPVAVASAVTEAVCDAPMPPRGKAPASNSVPPHTEASDQPTRSLHSLVDATEAGKHSDKESRSSLIDFLAPPQAADELGRLGDYRILQILGHGGMGVVFLAEDARLRRKVAIKAMLPHLAQSGTSKQRFEREARAAAALEHDHIVAIHHIFEDRGVICFVMPLLKGVSLDQRLQRGGPLPLAETLRIGREIAEGLAAAHARGMVHRDIKPANIWLEGDPGAFATAGRVKLLDFGLARAAAEDAGLTQQGVVVGTPAYMAPEQAAGAPVDARGDLFSLGIVLYRLCSGQPPFLGKDTISTLVAIATHVPAAPIQLNPALPQDLSDLVMKLLEKDPARRPGSAADVIHALSKLEQPFMPDGATVPIAIPVAVASAGFSDATSVISPAPASAPPRRSRPTPLLIACAAAAAGFLLLAGGALVYHLHFQTSDGTLVVEADNDAEVRFQKGELRIHDADGKLLYTLKPSEKNKTLPQGKYLLQVVGADGVILDTERFEMTRNGKVRVRVTLAPPPAPKTPAVKKDISAEKGVRDFAEIHDADEKAFDAWIAKMKQDGFRPARLSVQTLKDGPRYTAIALKEDKNWPWEFTRVRTDDSGHLDAQWKRKFEIVAHSIYKNDQGILHEVQFWAKNDSLNNASVWNGNEDDIKGKVRAARKDKDRLLSRTATFKGNVPEFAVVFEELDGIPWQEAYNVSFEDLKAYVEKHRGDGWRPDHLCFYGVGEKRLFGAILIKDANKTDWDVSWSLPPADYAKALTARRAQGFRPLTAIGHEDSAGAQCFSVIWIRYRADIGK